MKTLLEKLLRAESLTLEETEKLFEAMIGDAAPEMKAALLTALRAKTETETEILGMARQMRRHAVALPESMREAIDTCGTGGDGSRTLNISTLAALALASMGVPVVKHGNRSVSSSCGSADLLEGLGFPIDLGPREAAALFDKTRFAFLFAPLYHPAMKSVAPVRKALQVRTIFNFLGPLSNPANVSYQVLGVPAPERVRPFAAVLRGLGLKSAMVVHGEPGMDEISPCGETRFARFSEGGNIEEGVVRLGDIGLKPIPPDRLVVADVQESLRRAGRIIDGDKNDPGLTAVALNAAAGLLVFGKVQNIREGVEQVEAHLTGGRLKTYVEDLLKTAKNIKSNAA